MKKKTLEEMSRGVLQNYLRKATNDVNKRSSEGKFDKKLGNRVAGIVKAKEKLQEASTEKLSKYVKAAAFKLYTNDGKSEKKKRQAHNRLVGVSRASRKLTGIKYFDPEDNGDNAARVPATRKKLTEVSRDLLDRYMDKALKDTDRRSRNNDRQNLALSPFQRTKGDRRSASRDLAQRKSLNLAKVGATEKKKIDEENKKKTMQKKCADEIEIEPEKHLINNRQG